MPAARVVTPEACEAGGADLPAIEDQVEQLRQALTEAGPEDFERTDTGPDADPAGGPG